MIPGFVAQSNGQIGPFDYQIGMLNKTFATLIVDLKKDDRAVRNFIVGDLIHLGDDESVRVVCAQSGLLKVQPANPFTTDTAVLTKALNKILQIAQSKKK